MYSFEYNFFPDPAFRNDSFGDFDDTFNWFIGALRKNGQILGELDNVIEQHNLVDGQKRVQIRCIAPEQNSLDGKYHNVYCREGFSKIIEMSLRPPQLQLVGEVSDEPECCSCSSPSWYILFTHCYSISPPVDCGDCGLPVPLYTLPFIEQEEEYASLLNWQTTYQCFDRLFMLSGTGERSGLRQIAPADSELSVWGRELCAKMADKIERPFYYFLTQYYPQKEMCPGCSGDWRLEEPLSGSKLYTFKCDHCFLLSDEPSCTS